ncbi:MAG: glycosyltransferase family protein [Dehalococcoidia bacterium]
MAKRILMYFRGNGLGHLRRSRNIALAILKRSPESSILVLADEIATPFFAPVRGLDHIKLPVLLPARGAPYSTSLLNCDFDRVMDLRRNLILEVVKGFNPDVVLVDHGPVGVEGDLKPLLDRVASSPTRPKLYLGIRDILASPEQTDQDWTRLGVYDYLEYYDAVLVYGSSEFFDTAATYGLSSRVRRLIYCSYVAPPREELARNQDSDGPIILAMGGAGHDATAMELALVRALPLVQETIPYPAVVLTGPFMAPKDRQAIHREAQGCEFPPQVLNRSEDATQLIRRAELIVTLAGYNSMVEILQWQKKALVVPRMLGRSEQPLRTRLFAERGLVHWLSLEEATPDTMAQALLRLYHADNIPNPDNLPPFDGAQRAAAVILGEE